MLDYGERAPSALHRSFGRTARGRSIRSIGTGEHSAPVDYPLLVSRLLSVADWVERANYGSRSSLSACAISSHKWTLGRVS